MFQDRVLPAHSLELLRELSPLLAEHGFYLAGGTALAIRLGHRISVDLDFFCPEPFEPRELFTLIERACEGDATILQQSKGSICFVLRETKVELLHYPYPQINEHDLVDGLLLSSLADNSAMKLSDLTGRGSKKDLVDLAALIESTPLRIILAWHKEKYPSTEIFSVIKSLAWFQDAEEEPDPLFLHDQTWPEIKQQIHKALEDL